MPRKIRGTPQQKNGGMIQRMPMSAVVKNVRRFQRISRLAEWSSIHARTFRSFRNPRKPAVLPADWTLTTVPM